MEIKRKPARNDIWLTRKKRELSQKQLAEILGLKSQSLLTRWEKGYAFPDLTNALKLGIALGYPVEGLFMEHYRSLKNEILSNKDKSNKIKGKKKTAQNY